MGGLKLKTMALQWVKFEAERVIKLPLRKKES